MAAIAQFLAHIYTIIVVFFSILFLELIMLVRSLTGNVLDNHRRRGRRQPLTATQFLKLVEEKNPSIRYGAGLLTAEAKECAVCLSVFEDGEEVRKLKCKHTFHKDCLDTWLQQDLATCPLCRSNVLPDEIVSGYPKHRTHDDYYDGSDEEIIFFLSALHGDYFRRFLSY